MFDLISFSPAGRPTRIRRVRSQLELATRNLDKQSRTIQFAEQSFQQNFRQICKKEKAEIYKISAIDAGERFSVPLPCVFHLDLEGQASVRRDIDDESFGSRLEISEAITDALSNQERGNNESLRDFIQAFDVAILGRYVSGDSFDLRRYVQDVHLTKVAGYDDAQVTPMLGALHLQSNAALLLERIRAELTRADQPSPQDSDTGDSSDEDLSEKVIPEIPERDALWWAPQSALWARSRSARDLVQKLDRLLDSQPKEESSPAGGVRVVVPGDRRSARERLSVYWDQFPRLHGADVSLMNGNLELLLVPGRLVCAMFHFHLAHQVVAIPIGFVSSRPVDIRAASVLVSGRVRVKPGSISAAREEGGPEAVQDLLTLFERLSSSAIAETPTKDGRSRLTLKKSP